MNYLVGEVINFAWENEEALQRFVRACDDQQINAFEKYVAELAKREPVAPTWREPDNVFPQNDQVFTCQEFYRNAINFCYADPKTGEKFRIGKLSGSMAMGHCFFRKFGQEFIYAGDILKLTDTPGALEEFFAGDAPMPLLEERRICLREAATVLRERYNDRPANILVEAGFRAVREEATKQSGVVELLMAHFPVAYGQDKVVIEGCELTFAKRPYLWPLMYQGRAMEKDSLLTKLVDPERIGPVVDYQIPNALRHLGIIKYSDELARKIDTKVPIEKGSWEELAIRVSTVSALYAIFEMLRFEREEDQRLWTMVELDYELWSMGRAAAKAGLQHHLTLTTDY